MYFYNYTISVYESYIAHCCYQFSCRRVYSVVYSRYKLKNCSKYFWIFKIYITATFIELLGMLYFMIRKIFDNSIIEIFKLNKQDKRVENKRQDIFVFNICIIFSFSYPVLPITLSTFLSDITCQSFYRGNQNKHIMSFFWYIHSHYGL